MQCVILAGGLGTRIRERAAGCPKALIPVLGKPFIFYQLEWLSAQGVSKVVISIGHQGQHIAAIVGDGSKLGLSISYADEGKSLRGTGGALRLVADLGLLEPAFFVMYGDSYLPIQLKPLWEASEHGRVCTMAVLRNDGKWDRSNVIFQNGRLLLYDKRAVDPAAVGMNYIDFGISVLTRQVILDRVPQKSVYDLANLLHELSIKGELNGHEVSERFYEIGSPDGLDSFEAFMRTLSGGAVVKR